MIRTGLLTVAALIVLLSLYSVFWFVVADNIKSGIKTLANEWSGAGIRLQYEHVEINGYPLVFRTRITRPQISGSSDAEESNMRDWSWYSSRISAESRPWIPNEFKVNVSGSHKIELVRGTVTESSEVNARQSVIQVVLGNDGIPNIRSVTMGGLEVRDKRHDGRVNARHVRLQDSRLSLQELPNETPTFSVTAAIRALELPQSFSLPLGNKLERFSINFQVMGHLKRPINRDSLIAWRDNGGIIEVSDLEAGYGPLQLSASGTFALDHQLQPLAAMAAKLQGYVPALDQLRSARVIGPEQAALAKLFLGALARRDSSGGIATLRIPLNIRNGILTAQQVRLLSIPPLVWPGKPTKVK